MKLDIDFAFEGFRIIREKPLAILFWGILLLILNGSSMYILAAMAGDALSQLSSGETTDPQAMMALCAQMAPAYAIILPLSLIQSAVLSCAVYRCVLGDKNSQFAWMRFGAAELRQLLVLFLFLFVFMGTYLICILAGIAVGALLGMLLALVSQPLAVIGVVVGIVVALGLLIMVMVRLSLFAVQSFDQKKVNLFGSWKLTKGHAWPLFGGYVIMYIMVILVWLLCMVIFAAAVLILNQGDFSVLSPIYSGAMTADMFTQPVMIAYVVVINALVMPLAMALSLGATAAAYRRLSGHSQAAVEGLF